MKMIVVKNLFLKLHRIAFAQNHQHFVNCFYFVWNQI